MPPAQDQEPIPLNFPSFSEIKSIVESRFTLQDAYIDDKGAPTFIVTSENRKKEFISLEQELKTHQLIPILRYEDGQNILKVWRKPLLKKPSRPYLNILLLISVLVTIFLAGYFNFINTPILSQVLMKEENSFLQAILFTVCLFGIISLHESGHLLACRRHNMDATLPYFIPGPPPFGTFGAVVSLKSVPRNRDELFDTGIGGPLAGFLATIGVLLLDSFYKINLRVISLSQAIIWESEGYIQFVSWPYAPFLFYLQDFMTPTSSNQVLMPSPLQFVVLVGSLVTFLNILPIWQLDGGHISRAMWGAKGHRVASVIGLGLLFVGGYWFFAFFLLFLMFGSKKAFRGVEPLDDVSPLSNVRKIFYFITLFILVICFFIWIPLI